jgi:hypothetical protein
MKTFLNYVKLNRLTGDDLIICQNYAESCHTKKNHFHQSLFHCCDTHDLSQVFVTYVDNIGQEISQH